MCWKTGVNALPLADTLTSAMAQSTESAETGLEHVMEAHSCCLALPQSPLTLGGMNSIISEAHTKHLPEKRLPSHTCCLSYTMLRFVGFQWFCLHHLLFTLLLYLMGKAMPNVIS